MSARWKPSGKPIEMAKKNDGAPGIDGVTFEAIERNGVESFLEQIRDELIERHLSAHAGAEGGDTEGRGQGPRPFDSCDP